MHELLQPTKITDLFTSREQFDVDGVSIQLGDIAGMSRLDAIGEFDVTIGCAGELRAKDVASFMRAALSDPDPLHATLATLETTGQLRSIKAAPFSAGANFHVLFVEAKTDTDTCHFVLNISRAPVGTSQGRELAADLEGLQSLHSAFETHLEPQTREKFNIAKPGQMWNVDYGENQYTVTSQQFVPLPGLIVDLAGGIDDSDVQYYRYATYFGSINSHLNRFNQQQAQKASQAPFAVERIEKKFAGKPQSRIDQALRNQVPFLTEYAYQEHDYLTGCALVYLLSGNRFIQHMSTTTGDWVGEINPQGLSMILTTARKGLTQETMSDEEWITFMKKGAEINPDIMHRTGGKALLSFANIPDEVFAQALLRARKMIVN